MSDRDSPATSRPVRFPRALGPGDVVGVTSPSSGVAEAVRPRLAVALETVRGRGLEVRLGHCLDGASHISAPASERAAEFQAMLLDPEIAAVVPPWGGETAIDLIRLLDWDALAAAEPKWVVGFSDIATLITPLTLVAGWATLHGNNLMDTPYRVPDGLLGWLDIVTLARGSSFTQTSPRLERRNFVDYATQPGDDEFALEPKQPWQRLDAPAAQVEVTGRLIGGCLETLAHLAGSRYLDPTALADAGDGLIVYLEAAGDPASATCRALHGMRLNGLFDRADAVLVGSTNAPDDATLTQSEAVLDALGDLGVPILAGVECGHVAPYLPLVNGALATVRHDPSGSTIEQTLT